MPICTTCATPTTYLYTVYDSAYNFRLEQCTACHEFADPYVEHDTLTLLLDLILLKRDVYRHLLYNRGLGARKAAGRTSTNAEPVSASAQHGASPHYHDPWARWWLIAQLGLALICVDAFIRWTHISSNQPADSSQIASWNQDVLQAFVRILVGCFFETVAFHVGVILACWLVLHLLPAPSSDAISGIRAHFRYSHIPLALFYSSLTKLFLLFCLSIWRPDSAAPPPTPQGQPAASAHAHGGPGHWYPPAADGRGGGGDGSAVFTFTHPFAVRALGLLDEDTLDREWVVRNVLGGMAAGFGLRVVLDCHPVFTTMIILAGWAVKTGVARLVSEWVGTGVGFLGGNDKAAEEMWLAYSIP